MRVTAAWLASTGASAFSVNPFFLRLTIDTLTVRGSVHRVITVVLKRKSSAPAKPASVSMVNRKKKGLTLKADAPVDASHAAVTRIELPTDYGRVCNAAQREPYVPRELSYRGRA